MPWWHSKFGPQCLQGTWSTCFLTTLQQWSFFKLTGEGTSSYRLALGRFGSLAQPETSPWPWAMSQVPPWRAQLMPSVAGTWDSLIRQGWTDCWPPMPLHAFLSRGNCFTCPKICIFFFFSPMCVHSVGDRRHCHI